MLNIPFALLAALVALWLTGQTINLMTLGGLALAIGILVDEATVEVENIHHQMEGTASVARAVRRGNQQTAVPRLLAMLCVLAVFMPSFFMEGAARALFVPLSLAVGFAMVALVSALQHVRAGAVDLAAAAPSPRRAAADGAGVLVRPGPRRLRPRRRRRRAAGAGLVVPAYLAGAAAVIVLVGRPLGLEIFPKVDAGRVPAPPAGARTAPGSRRPSELAIAALRRSDRDREVGRDNVAISVGYVRADPVELSDQRHLPVDAAGPRRRSSASA